MEKNELIQRLEQAPGKTFVEDGYFYGTYKAGYRGRNNRHRQKACRCPISKVRSALLHTGNQALKEAHDAQEIRRLPAGRW